MNLLYGMIDIFLQGALEVWKLGSGATKAQPRTDVISLGLAELAFSTRDTDLERDSVTHFQAGMLNLATRPQSDNFSRRFMAET